MRGLPPDSGVDAMHRAMPEIARGNLQRIREGVGPRHATLLRIAEALGVPVAELLTDGAQPAASWPFQFVDQARWMSASQAERGYIEAAINRALDECEAARRKPALRA